MQRENRRSLTLRLLLLADLFGLTLAYAATSVAMGLLASPDEAFTATEILLFAVTLPLWPFLATLQGLYTRDAERPDHGTIDDAGSVFNMVTCGVLLLIAADFAATGDQAIHGPALLLFAVSAFLLVLVCRALARIEARRRDGFVQNAVIVGAGDVGQTVAEKLLGRSQGLNLVGFVDDDPRPLRESLGHVAVLGPVKQLPELIDLFDVDRVIFAFSRLEHGHLIDLVRRLKGHEVQVDIVPRLFDSFGTRAGVHTIQGLPLVALPVLRLSRPALMAKRAMDVIVAGTALVLFAPLLAYLAVRVKRDSPGPVFYRHERVGKNGRSFGVYKFRTMKIEFCRGDRYGGDGAEQAFADLMADPARRAEFDTHYKLADDPRVTKVGKMLRATSLDELPQLLNVLKGDISLVGPRPITTDELERYGNEADTLLNLPPGLTGYWQISGRSDAAYTERVRLDLAYVTSWSLRTDVNILAKTVQRVAARDGAV